MSVRLITAGAAFLALATVSGAAAQSQPFRPPSEREPTRQVQGFNIVLVLGETQPSGRVEATRTSRPARKRRSATCGSSSPTSTIASSMRSGPLAARASTLFAGQLRGIAAGPARTSSSIVNTDSS